MIINYSYVYSYNKKLIVYFYSIFYRTVQIISRMHYFQKKGILPNMFVLFFLAIKSWAWSNEIKFGTIYKEIRLFFLIASKNRKLQVAIYFIWESLNVMVASMYVFLHFLSFVSFDFPCQRRPHTKSLFRSIRLRNYTILKRRIS